MSQIDVPLSRAGFGQTQRADNWWVQPLVVFIGVVHRAVIQIAVMVPKELHIGRSSRRSISSRNRRFCCTVKSRKNPRR